MKLIEKYLNEDVNLITSFVIRFLISVNRRIRKKVDAYMTISQDLKYLFITQYAEKELVNDENLRNYDFYNEFCFELRK